MKTDCIGAVQIVPDEHELPSVRTINSEALSEHEIENILSETTSFDLFRIGNMDDFRISLAGAQEKNALTFHNNGWVRPLGTTPSTHIFKLPIGDIGFADLSTSVENEWLCMQILKRYGIETSASLFAGEVFFSLHRCMILCPHIRSWVTACGLFTRES